MNLNSLLTWENVPEFLLTGLWYIEIIDDNVNNSVFIRDFVTDFDIYAKSITIPTVKYNIEKTSFGLPFFTEREELDDVSIVFRDDINLNVSKFIQKWMESIFDINKNALKKRWRYEKKDIHAVQFKILNKSKNFFESSVLATTSSVVGNILSVSSTLNLGQPFISDYIDLKLIAEYNLLGCLPKGLDSIELDEGDGQPQEFTLELHCDVVKPVLNQSLITT